MESAGQPLSYPNPRLEQRVQACKKTEHTKTWTFPAYVSGLVRFYALHSPLTRSTVAFRNDRPQTAVIIKWILLAPPRKRQAPLSARLPLKPWRINNQKQIEILSCLAARWHHATHRPGHVALCAYPNTRADLSLVNLPINWNPWYVLPVVVPLSSSEWLWYTLPHCWLLLLLCFKLAPDITQHDPLCSRAFSRI